MSYFDLASGFSPWCLAIDLNNLIVHLRGKLFFCYKQLPTTSIAGGLLWKIFRFAPHFLQAHEPKQKRHSAVHLKCRAKCLVISVWYIVDENLLLNCEFLVCKNSVSKRQLAPRWADEQMSRWADEQMSLISLRILVNISLFYHGIYISVKENISESFDLQKQRIVLK